MQRRVTSDFPEIFYYPLSRGWAASRTFFRRRQPRLHRYLLRPESFQALVTALHMLFQPTSWPVARLGRRHASQAGDSDRSPQTAACCQRRFLNALLFALELFSSQALCVQKARPTWSWPKQACNGPSQAALAQNSFPALFLRLDKCMVLVAAVFAAVQPSSHTGQTKRRCA